MSALDLVGRRFDKLVVLRVVRCGANFKAETDDSVTVRGVAVARCGGCKPEGCDRPSIEPGTVLRVLSLVGAWS